MNRILVLVVLLLSILPLKAQTKEIEIEYASLTSQIDSLERKVDFINLEFEIYSLRNDIITSAHNMDIKTLDMQLGLFLGKVDNDFKKAYNVYFNSCLEAEESYYKLIEVKKEYLTSKIIGNKVAKKDIILLMGEMQAVDTAFDSFKSSLSVLKSLLNIYNNL